MLLNFDLSGAEWVVVSYLCRDENMLSVVRSGKSPHPVTASRMTGIDEATIVHDDDVIGLLRDPDRIAELRAPYADKLKNAVFLPRTMSIRQAGKKSNHGLNYREGWNVFSIQNEVETTEAKRMCALYTCQCPPEVRVGATHYLKCNPAYPGVRDWWDSIDTTLRQTRHLTNCFGRKCFFMGQMGNDLFKQGYAFLPQSTVFDSCAMGMQAALEDTTPEFAPAQLCAQVHDSLLFDYLSTDFSAMAAFALRMKDYMSPTIDYGEPFRLGVDLKVGFDWRAMEKVKLTPDIDKLAEKLRDAHARLRTSLEQRRAA